MPSTLTLSRDVTLQWPDRRLSYGSAATKTTPHQVESPDFPLRFQFTYDREVYRYALRWWDSVPMRISGGRILVRAGNKGIMDFTLLASTFPSTPQGAFYSSKDKDGSPSKVHIEISLSLAPPAGPTLEPMLHEERQLNAVSSAMYMSRQVPHDVALVFPRTQKVLWASEQSLSAASPYFKTLFSSDFAENSTTDSFETLKSVLTSAKSDETSSSEDSDDETDASLPPARFEALPNVPFKLVKITDTSYTTYANVLVWLRSRYIAFAPLSSSFKGAPASTRLTPLKALQSDPALPLPSSPKSVYRLAHLLSLTSLSSLALDNLRTQLTPSKAAYELYSSTVTTYPAVRDVVLDYVVEHWAEVVESSSLREMEERAGREELPVGAAQTGIVLARRLTQKGKK
ncbi:hypothetical protein NBRC10512_003855 [Rhodotorula toruloides]|uniref:RHTO0S02e04368g1_1 n=2 Tax=Rhodotorula toruloides TaxID=5286 RepID=A0A061APF0_RHOTO|nr:BTB/POZ-like domain containing protein [Rhodotorula toruloides NP11]EMS21962.1 BTB/POZ-like domain containing protein [Rhodotorula toruloides NP11]CDR36605.1 RHTO0S02e04368g1_1 [Rhodotorula toruloides]